MGVCTETYRVPSEIRDKLAIGDSLREANKLIIRTHDDSVYSSTFEHYLFNRVLGEDELQEIRRENAYIGAPGSSYVRVSYRTTKRRTWVIIHYGMDI